MIRFSAGLVVVAIGVLIGGVATSKLSLVYAAIAVSALALITLAIGVALKRDELFGGGPELAPAKHHSHRKPEVGFFARSARGVSPFSPRPPASPLCAGLRRSADIAR